MELSGGFYRESTTTTSYHGICNVALSMKNTIPILHGPSGCFNYEIASLVISEKQGHHAFTSNILATDLACSSFDNLQKAIIDAYKLKPELIIVTTTNVTELIASEQILESVVEEVRRKIPVPIVVIYGGTLNNNMYQGVDKALTILTENFAKEQRLMDNSVNIIGPVKGVYNWRADLLEIIRLLKCIGLKLNTIVPAGASIKDFEKLPAAQLNILTYPYDFGLTSAIHLEKEYGTPYIYTVPYGVENTIKFLEELIEYFPNLSKNIDRLIEREMRFWGGNLIDDLDISGYTIAGSPIAIFGMNTLIYGLTKVLEEDLWLTSKILGVKNKKNPLLNKFYRKMRESGVRILFEPSKEEIVDVLKEDSPYIVFGSFIEYLASREAKIQCFIPVSEPIRYFSSRYLDAPFRGIRGVSYLLHRVWEETIKYVYSYTETRGEYSWDLKFEENALKYLIEILNKVPAFVRSKVKFVIENLLEKRVGKTEEKVCLEDIKWAIKEAMKLKSK